MQLEAGWLAVNLWRQASIHASILTHDRLYSHDVYDKRNPSSPCLAREHWPKRVTLQASARDEGVKGWKQVMGPRLGAWDLQRSSPDPTGRSAYCRLVLACCRSRRFQACQLPDQQL